MCEPTTILAVTSIASTAFAAYSSIEQGRTQKAVAEFNAREGENEATRVRNRGAEAENEQRRKVAELQSRQRAQLGAANLDIDTGSAFDLQNDAELLGEADALRIRSNFQDQADSLDRGVSLTTAQGNAASTAGRVGAIGSLLEGGSRVDPKWFNNNSAANQGSTPGLLGG